MGAFLPNIFPYVYHNLSPRHFKDTIHFCAKCIFCNYFLQKFFAKYLVFSFIFRYDRRAGYNFLLYKMYPVWEIYQASLDIGIIVPQISQNIPDSR